MSQTPAPIALSRVNQNQPTSNIKWKNRKNKIKYSGPPSASNSYRSKLRIQDSRPASARPVSIRPVSARPVSTRPASACASRTSSRPRSGRTQLNMSRMGVSISARQTTLDEVVQTQVKMSIAIDNLRRKLEKLKQTISALELDIRDEDKLKNVPMRMLVSNRKKIKKLECQLLRTRQERSDNQNQINQLKQRVNRARMEKMSKLHTQREWAKDVQKKEEELANLKQAIQRLQDSQAHITFEIDDVKKEATAAVNEFNDNVGLVQNQLHATRSKLSESGVDLNENLKTTRETFNPKSYINHRKHLYERVSEKRQNLQDLHQKKNQIMIHESMLQNQAQTLDEMGYKVEEILERAGCKDVETFVKVMAEEEERHFSVFTLINEMSTEEEALQREQKMLQQQIDERQNALDADQNKKQHKFEELKETLKRYEDMMQEHTSRYEEEIHLLDAVRDTFLSTFVKMGCGEGAGAALRAAGVNEQNLLDFLGPMEDRIDTFLQMYSITNREPVTKLVERMRLMTPSSDLEDIDEYASLASGVVSNLSSPHTRGQRRLSDAWAVPAHQQKLNTKMPKSMRKPQPPSMAFAVEDDQTLTDSEVESCGERRGVRPLDTATLKKMVSRSSPMRSHSLTHQRGALDAVKVAVSRSTPMKHQNFQNKRPSSAIQHRSFKGHHRYFPINYQKNEGIKSNGVVLMNNARAKTFMK